MVNRRLDTRHLPRHLNYTHLLYFWTVAREGTVAAAAAALNLTPQTISGQVKLLEQSIGARLFERSGRGLVLTEAGRSVMPYAEEIFSLGAELARRVQGDDLDLPATLHVGVVNSLPKLIAYRTLEPLVAEANAPRLICVEGDLEKLLADLAVHRLDLLLSDRPVPPGFNVRAYSHKLGDSEMAFYGSPPIAEALATSFPASLATVPMLLPAGSSAIRRDIDDWLASVDVVPRIIAEFDDSALMKAFAESGKAVFPAPVAIETEVQHMYGVARIGRIENLREMFYLISAERRLSEPFALKITEAARSRLSVR